MKRLLLLCAVVLACGAFTSLAQSPPALLIDFSTGSQVRLSWTNTPGNIVLEETDTLTPTSVWRPFPQNPTLLNGQFSVLVDITGITRFFRLHTIQTGGLPPDPASIAPPIPQGVATLLAGATEFLYTGPNPIQTGVAPGTIEVRRVAVLRGKVQTRDGAALSGVTITILAHLEFGQTLSRLDGMFDLAVNGGGVLTVNYQKAGYLPVQRQFNTPWQDYAYLPEVVMIPLDAQVTPIDLSAATPIQVAQGSPVTDSDGTRRATLLFTQGTTATTAGGTPLTNLNIRATEYTVGPNGPKAMPAALPPTSGYTYAVEFSADEAPGQEVRFSKPIITYVDNFLNFPVGGIVPVGYYDRVKAAWIPSDNGRVIKLLSITGGMAALDTNGDGVADDAATLAALDVTDAERQKLAALYSAGQSLWRVPITHFTPHDCNWPYGAPPDALPPGLPPPQADPKLPDSKIRCNSIIECQNQVLGESAGITGTPFSLNYRSDRVPGRKTAYTLEIPLSGASLPASMRRIDLEISVAGRQFAQSFPAAPNQRHSFTWDGKDAYGRTLQGGTPVTVRIGDVYGAVYQEPAQFAQSFLAISGIPMTESRERIEETLWQETQIRIGTLDFRPLGLGGWSLSPHHAYDPAAKILYQGDGTRRDAQGEAGSVITTVAGNGTYGFSGDGGPATQAALGYPIEVAVAADGSLYFADNDNARIRRVGPDGVITTVAGNGSSDFSGDGGPATQAGIGFQQGRFPTGLAVAPNGSLYIGDRFNNRVRRVGPDGIITTVAGSDTGVFLGDGGPATQASLMNPSGVAVAPDGSLYIADYGSLRIRRVGPDGIITTVAGSGVTPGFSGDGGPATQAALDRPHSVAVAPDGSLYFVDGGNNRIRRVGADGIITTVAMTTWALNLLNGGLAVAPDGSLYFADTGNHRISRVGPDGIITTVAGSDTGVFPGDGGPATQAALYYPRGVAVAPDRSLYIADMVSNRIRRVAPSMPGVSVGELAIASEDGAELHIFSSSGHHLRTLNALTGAVRYQFGYDSAGRLASITDGDGNVTSIERDLAGNATAIVAPFGQRTTLTLDANGYLASIANPANETKHMTYTADGLLTAFTDPKGNSSVITYDTLGRLIKDQNAANGFWALTRTEQATGYSVSMTSALNRTTVDQIENLTTGDQRRLDVAPDGTTTETLIKTDGTRTETAADGTITTTVAGPDPRFGMEAPLTKSLTLTLPSGLSLVATTERTVNLAQPSDALSLISETETSTLNGRAYTSRYEAATRTFTITTPQARQTTAAIDAQGRIVRSEVPGVAPVLYTYDTRGRLASVTQGTGVVARTANLSYNTNGYLDTVTDPLGRTLSLAYDAAGRVTRQTLPDGGAILYGSDASGNLTSLTPPGRPAHLFSYTPVDLPREYTPPDVGAGSNSTRYEYDLDKKLTRTTRPDGQILDFGYDSGGGCNCGRLSTLTLPTGLSSYAYDATTGKLTGITAPGGIGLSYSYDGALLTGVTWTGPVSGAIAHTYNNDFLVTTQNVNGADSVSFDYDADDLLTTAGSLSLTRNPQNGLLTGTTLGSATDTWEYDGFGEVTAYSANYSGSEIFKNLFTYDKLGRITTKTETVAGTTTTFEYVYDLAGRLTGVKKNGTVTATYTYDSNGNRTGGTGPGGTASATYDNQDRLLTYGGATHSYTANGELLSKTAGGQITSYQYDALGNLTSVTLPGGQAIEYLIDGRNRRIGKKVNGVLVQAFLYQGQLRPVAEMDSAGNAVSRFVYATRSNVPDYMIKGGVTYRIITDHLGSPRLVVDVATGTVAQRMDYDEFGQVLSDTNPGFQPFGFAGGLYDRDTKLVRFGARDYDPETGRWSAKDPILFAGGDTNLYGYVGNDPMNQSDPYGFEGMSYWEIFKLGLRDIWPIYKGVKKVKKVVGMVENAEKVSCDIENLKKDWEEKQRVEDSIRRLTYDQGDAMPILDSIHNQQMDALGHGGDLAEDAYKLGYQLQRAGLKGGL